MRFCTAMLLPEPRSTGCESKHGLFRDSTDDEVFSKVYSNAFHVDYTTHKQKHRYTQTSPLPPVSTWRNSQARDILYLYSLCQLEFAFVHKPATAFLHIRIRLPRGGMSNRLHNVSECEYAPSKSSKCLLIFISADTHASLRKSTHERLLVNATTFEAVLLHTARNPPLQLQKYTRFLTVQDLY
jgi:hypothetical protein